MLFNVHYGHYCALNHCFNYLINIIASYLCLFYQRELEGIEAEDNTCISTNNSKSTFLNTVKPRITNLEVTNFLV